MGGPQPPIPCYALHWKGNVLIELFEIIYGITRQCLSEGTFTNNFILRVIFILASLLVLGLYVKRLPKKRTYKKRLQIMYYITLSFFLIIFLSPILSILINKIIFIRKYGWYGDKNYTDTTLFDLLIKAF
ncbi:hypothetical protein A2714_05295 [Candidatus Woesebacteria bacterium RIFCSPHIGHO2_01_FULL_38_9]|uniref:Uncharacterized protein n=2 Tax=Candidatus Woeseibacteriota TaxID=1752722 RepID=A0A1F7Y4X4_9BACT|nr:MAG: hypothetical protein A2714_05295 [Candidatus Woesebacteria bacterium RIFCSPHIGHO2_01_FULL_38_9]OGM59077.1 MAG: hypothetical protein A3A75_05425 [Candidatus Woesebacteria bacterium RIFCSPLOWO2_01_FULL_39_10]